MRVVDIVSGSNSSNLQKGELIRNIKVEIIENPSANKHELNVGSLIGIARRGFGSEISEEDVVRHTLCVDFLHLLYLEGQLAGFASYNRRNIEGVSKQKISLTKIDVLYLSGIVIDNQHQKKGLYGVSIRTAVTNELPAYIAMRTQNPSVYSSTLLLEFIMRLYPDLSLDLPPQDVISIARELSKELGMVKMDQQTFVERRTYGQSLYTHEPKSGDSRINTLFDVQLGLNKNSGDSVLLIGEIDISAVLKSNLRQ